MSETHGLVLYTSLRLHTGSSNHTLTVPVHSEARKGDVEIRCMGTTSMAVSCETLGLWASSCERADHARPQREARPNDLVTLGCVLKWQGMTYLTLSAVSSMSRYGNWKVFRALSPFDNDRADKRCPLRFYVFARIYGERCKIHDCENRNLDLFCPISLRPWIPTGNPDKSVPPLDLHLWSVQAQRVWQNFMKARPLYEPPHSPLPYTTGNNNPFEMTREPEPYLIRVRSPNKGEERCKSAKKDRDNHLHPPSAVNQVDADDIDTVLSSSPPTILRTLEDNFLRDDPIDESTDPHEAKTVRRYGAMEKSPTRTRSTTRLEEISEDSEDNIQETEPLEIVPATEGELKYFEKKCRQVD
jgi:hypothetical protein